MSTPKRVRNELAHCHAVIGELRRERDQAQRFVFLERAKRDTLEKAVRDLFLAKQEGRSAPAFERLREIMDSENPEPSGR